jgi:hypothetical protein
MLFVDEVLHHAFFVGAAFVDERLGDQVLAEPAKGVSGPGRFALEGCEGNESGKGSGGGEGKRYLASRMLVMPLRR